MTRLPNVDLITLLLRIIVSKMTIFFVVEFDVNDVDVNSEEDWSCEG